MFSLIITIVSIALVVALVAATMYYGGDTLSQGRERADAAAFVSGGQQISSAIQLHKALDGGELNAVDPLSTLTSGGKYLTSLPSVKSDGDWGVNVDDRILTIQVASAEVCNAINFQAGEDVSVENYTAPTTASDLTFGCTSGNQFFYKY